MVPSSETTKDITGWIPLANATVTLTDSEGVTHTVTTDEDGYYTFTDIAVNANTIITATATVDGNTVIIKDVIPQAIAADEDYNAGTADAESTALALIVEELLEQGLDPEDINLEEIQDSDNFTEVVEQVSSILEENGNVTTDPGVTETVSNAAEDIINPPAYIPPTTYTLTTAVLPGSSGTVSGAGTYDVGTVVPISATPASGYSFVNWIGDVANTGLASTTVTMDADKTVTANFALITHDLTMAVSLADGGTTTPAVGVHNYTAGTVVDITANPASGYHFVNWTGAVTGSVNPTTVTMDADKTVTANFERITYTVTYDGNTNTSGVVPTDANPYEQGQSVTVLGKGSLVKTGYTFGGWNTAANGTGTSRAAGSTFIMGTANVTLYAQWTINSYTVTFNSQGGSAVNTQTVEHGGKVTEPTDPTKTGHTFGGWYKESGCTNAWDFDSDTVTADVTLFAKWTINTYTVTYDGNGSTGGTVPVDSSSPYEYEATVTVLGNTGILVKTGYTFNVWNTAADGSGTNRAAGDIFTMGTANVMLYAQWTANPTYTVTTVVDPAGSGTVTGAGTYDAGTVVPITAIPADGYQFVNWTGAVTGSVNPTTVTMDADKTVTANFAQITYDLTMQVDPAIGGTTIPAVGGSPHNYPVGTVVPISATPASGYSFVNWIGDVVDPNSASTTVTMNGDQTVTATFDLTKVTLIMAVAGTGSGTTNPAVGTYTLAYDYGEVVDISALANTGSVFTGWSANVAAPGSAATTVTMNGDQTVTATFDLRALNIVAGSGLVTITSNYGDVVTGSAVATITSGGTGTTWKNLGDKLQARVTTTFPTYMTRLVLTPTATTDVVIITGQEQIGRNISSRTLTVVVRDKTYTTITKSFTVNVSGNGSGNTLTIGTITVP